MLRRKYPDGPRMELVDDAGPAPFPMAAEAVHQCLLNLALNAVEALRDEADADASPLLRLIVRRERSVDGSEVVGYTVADNGPGMPADLLDASASFVSGKATGSGIGLFATRKTAHEMGADLRFTSSPGKGTEATLRLGRGAFGDNSLK